ncbi:MAG: putative metal-binding motif-containing protein, partial [Myxococcota bacterium]
MTRLSLAALALLMFALLPAPARAAESCSGEFVTYYLCGGDGVEETICDSGDPGARPVEETVTWSCPVRCGTGLRECRVYRDCDGDTWGADLVVNVGSCSSATRGGDCDDNPSSGASVNPGVAEICFDGIDNNCDGDLDEVLVDVDDDGSFVEILCRPEAPDADEDCNDNDDEVFPGNTEVCDGKDNDCNGEVDWFRFEECNGIDDDCDGVADSQDWDNDGAPYLACTPAAGDCHDGDPQVFPGRADFCGPIVPDCHYSTLGEIGE